MSSSSSRRVFVISWKPVELGLADHIKGCIGDLGLFMERGGRKVF